MKYFTAERILRLQDRSQEQAFRAALEDWERALAEYRERWQQVRPELPADLGQLLDTVSLHDARVLDMWWGGRSQCTITLHPESAPSRLLVLTYSLLEPPDVRPDVLPASVRSEPVAWLYDELGFGADPPASEPVFTHNILLSDGREVRLRFRNVQVKRPVPLVPVVSAGDATQPPVRHSA
jgi:hypothetical protein